MIIVAEIGSNHCGSLPLALSHIEEAARSGANAVKFQLFRAETLDSRPEVQANLRPYELPLDWLPRLHRAAHDEGLLFICTPFDLPLAAALRGYVDMVKISAYDLTYHALIEEAAGLGVPIILSTAMGTWEDIHSTIDSHLYGSRDIYLLHGTACYPTRLRDANLSAMEQMIKVFLQCRVGLSDHTLGSEAAVLAAALGAEMIEKHFALEGVSSPDAPHSANPYVFQRMVKAVERTKKILGSGWKKGPLPCELPLFTTCRRTNEKPLRG